MDLNPDFPKLLPMPLQERVDHFRSQVEVCGDEAVERIREVEPSPLGRPVEYPEEAHDLEPQRLRCASPGSFVEKHQVGIGLQGK